MKFVILPAILFFANLTAWSAPVSVPVEDAALALAATAIFNKTDVKAKLFQNGTVKVVLWWNGDEPNNLG